MTQIETLILFVDLFRIKDEIEEWFPNGLNSVRIRLKENAPLPFDIPKVDLIFTAKSRENWKLETADSFIDALNNSYEAGYNKGRADEKKEILEKINAKYMKENTNEKNN
jgi:hypothetical protein